MKHDEYAIMFRVEDRHWWYRALRAMLRRSWRYVNASRPRLLDVGCGTGANLASLRGLAHGVGIDMATEAVRFCRERGETVTAVASALELPFPDASFEVVLSCDVLCHRSIADKAAPLRQMHRVLKPGGLLMLNLPAYQWLLSSHDTYVHTDHRFTRAECLRLLRDSGFTPIYATYWNTLLFPPILLVRLWRKMSPPRASDLDAGSGERLTFVFRALFSIEHALLRLAPLPFGLSVFVVGRK